MRRWIPLVLIGAFAASQLWGPPAIRFLDSRGVGCGMSQVLVRGRLVDAATGAALAERGVAAFEHAHQLDASKLVEIFARCVAADRAARAGTEPPPSEVWEGMYVAPEAHALTDGAGRFEVQVTRWSCTYYVGDEVVGKSDPDPRRALHALLVEGAGGGAPVPVRELPPGTTWPTAASREPFSAGWVVDLGDVRVPEAPTER
jgi:hypothetical protein